MGFLNGVEMPFCAGCAYHTVVKELSRALEESGFSPLDVVLVSDIGCCGLVDKVLNCHTLHGLHGRANAVAAGISIALCGKGKKVIVFMGDGGATIGLQHILESARLNLDITTIVVNNFIYGMTGGQPSALCPKGYRPKRALSPRSHEPFDVVRLAHQAGAALSLRTSARPGVKEELKEAVVNEGFALVEILGPCISHGVKRLSEIESMGHPMVKLINHREPYSPQQPNEWSPQRPVLRPMFSSSLSGRTSGEEAGSVSLVIAGSAGEGVQTAGELLERAGVLSGLNTTRKSDYPITVGKGFSLTELHLSSRPILYTGMEKVDVLVVTSAPGLEKVLGIIPAFEGTAFMDESLPTPKDWTGKVYKAPFRKNSGKKTVNLCALGYAVSVLGHFPVEALPEAARGFKYYEDVRKAVETGAGLVG